MDRITVKLENCYGIKKLEKEFDFSSSKTFAIYASNGSMKSSFANVFRDINNNVDSRDLVFADREPIRDIKKSDNSNLLQNETLVIDPYFENYNSEEKVSMLLVNQDLKKEYDEIYSAINTKKDNLIKELKKISGLKSGIEEEISLIFYDVRDRFFDTMESIEKILDDNTELEFSGIIYKEVFNDKVVGFLKEQDSAEMLNGYIEKYNSLIEASKYFKKGVFNHTNALLVAKSLADNGFFKASHSIALKNKHNESNDVLYSEEEFIKIIEEEKKAILNNPELIQTFNAIDKKLSSNIELKSFREYLSNNRRILPELVDLDGFRKKIMISYIKNSKELYTVFLDEYKKNKDRLDEIIKEAANENEKWVNVINIFDSRFSVPFKLVIENQEDVILKKEIPIISFIFQDYNEESPIKKGELVKVLSSGEKRALYLLNIIFEIEVRKEVGQKTLFIIDDIADSFDYKNKYAIIQYLKDISENPIFYQIILTHNFDFFRTIASRCVVNYDHCFFANKKETGIDLVRVDVIKNPFINNWKSNLGNPKKLIASIPFTRNIIEYTKSDQDDDYLKLTSLLHWKNNTESITMSDLNNIFSNTFNGVDFPQNNLSETIIGIIFAEADNCLVAVDGIYLENKIVLSIAIRLKAEKLMIDGINDSVFVDGITKGQTRKLFNKYKEINPGETSKNKAFEDVLLMTSENIHINSFMYEPILDMSDNHLRNLYNKLKEF